MSARAQLESLRAFVACEGRRGRPETASQLRVCIADHLHADAQLKAAVDAVLLCAYGAAPHEPRARIPPRAAVVEARPAPAVPGKLNPCPAPLPAALPRSLRARPRAGAAPGRSA